LDRVTGSRVGDQAVEANHGDLVRGVLVAEIKLLVERCRIGVQRTDVLDEDVAEHDIDENRNQ